MNPTCVAFVWYSVTTRKLSNAPSKGANGSSHNFGSSVYYLISVTMIKYPNQRQSSKENGLSWLTVSEGHSPSQQGRHDCRSMKLAWQSESRLITFHPHTGRREQEQEVEPGYKASKPSPNDIQPPTRLYCLRLYNLSQQNYQLGQVSKCMSWGHFEFKPQPSATPPPPPPPAITTLSSASLWKLYCRSSFLGETSVHSRLAGLYSLNNGTFLETSQVYLFSSMLLISQHTES